MPHSTNHPIPAGFRLSGVACGIKLSEKRDLTLIVADQDCVAAGVYTRNVVQSAAVISNRVKTPTDRCRAVIINSGNANACTGQRGREDNQRLAELAADACGAEADQALVMSTGVIGSYLPMDCIASGVRAAAASLARDENALRAAIEGMMTTDKFPKLASRGIQLGEGQVLHVTGMAKGAGMIGPNMATMLAVVMTDAALTPDAAQTLLGEAVDESFNCMSVEGHMSTSDTVLLIASGASPPLPPGSVEMEKLRAAVHEVCVELAQMIPDDGEGSSHLITIDVRGCATKEDAHRIASSVANSALVKTGIAGADPNWGRIVSAAGYAGVAFDPDQLRLAINGTQVYEGGTPVEFDEAAVSASLRTNRVVLLELTLAEGDQGIRFWTSDLTVEYVRFNSEYTT